MPNTSEGNGSKFNLGTFNSYADSLSAMASVVQPMLSQLPVREGTVEDLDEVNRATIVTAIKYCSQEQADRRGNLTGLKILCPVTGDRALQVTLTPEQVLNYIYEFMGSNDDRMSMYGWLLEIYSANHLPYYDNNISRKMNSANANSYRVITRLAEAIQKGFPQLTVNLRTFSALPPVNIEFIYSPFYVPVEDPMGTALAKWQEDFRNGYPRDFPSRGRKKMPWKWAR